MSDSPSPDNPVPDNSAPDNSGRNSGKTASRAGGACATPPLADDGAPAPQGVDEPAAGQGAVPESDAALIRSLSEENQAQKDRILRLMAEMENLRQRTEREVRNARQFSVTEFALDMLAVSDNLRRAMECASGPEGGAEKNTEMRGVLDGVSLTASELQSRLERHGVKPMEPLGKRFDPHFHQAMFEVEDSSVAGNTVVQIVQEGYIIGERVLRPAMVGVSKGGPRDAQAVPSGDAAQVGAHPATGSDDQGDASATYGNGGGAVPDTPQAADDRDNASDYEPPSSGSTFSRTL